MLEVHVKIFISCNKELQQNILSLQKNCGASWKLEKHTGTETIGLQTCSLKSCEKEWKPALKY